MEAIILAGGKGTRLMPLTKHLPKPLIPLTNRAFILSLIYKLIDSGYDRIIISVGHNTHVFFENFRKLKFDAEVIFAHEDEPLGTGGAIKYASQYMETDNVLVLNGDIFSSLDYIRLRNFHNLHNSYATLTIKEVENPLRFGVVLTDDDGYITNFMEKPEIILPQEREINAGIYMLERELIKEIPNGAVSLERTVFPNILNNGLQMMTYREDMYWSDLGTCEDYLATHKYILDHKEIMPQCSKVEEVMDGVFAEEPISFPDDVTLIKPVMLGKNVLIKENCVIGPYVTLGDNCDIGKNSEISNSVLWNNTHVKDNTLIDNTISGRHSTLCSNVQNEVVADAGLAGNFNTLNYMNSHLFMPKKVG